MKLKYKIAALPLCCVLGAEWAWAGTNGFVVLLDMLGCQAFAMFMMVIVVSLFSRQAIFDLY